MKIGILVYSLAGGGAERVVSYLLSHFKSMGIDVHLILMNDNIKYPVPEDVKIHFIEKSSSKESGLKKLLKIPMLALRYSRLSKKIGLDISFSLLTRPNYINIISGFFNKRLDKLIISERAFPSLQYGYRGLSSKINRFLITTLYPKPDLIICNSRGNKQDLVDNFGIPEKIVKVINNPIDFDSIDQITPIEGVFDKAYFNMVSVGRLDQGKNHKLLINAISNFKNVRLYILGDGVLRTDLQNLIQSKKLEDRVFLLGFQPNPYTYLKNPDLFIFGSNHEGFPNVLLEAMACGLPILTTNCKSGPDEIMEYDKEEVESLMMTDYGILVPVNNEKLMQDGIQHFISNPEYHLKCKQRVMERVQDFNTSIILKEFEHTLFQK